MEGPAKRLNDRSWGAAAKSHLPLNCGLRLS